MKQQQQQQPKSQLYISASVADSLPLMVKNELAKMSAQKQTEFVEEYKRKAKSLGLGYVFLLIVFSAHYGYLKKWGMQLVFWFTLGGFTIWWLVNIFRLPEMIKNYNKDVAMETMRNLKVMSS